MTSKFYASKDIQSILSNVVLIIWFPYLAKHADNTDDKCVPNSYLGDKI